MAPARNRRAGVWWRWGRLRMAYPAGRPTCASPPLASHVWQSRYFVLAALLSAELGLWVLSKKDLNILLSKITSDSHLGSNCI